MISNVPVLKVNGTGNDFLLVDERETPLADPVGFAIRHCDRVHGIGADGLIIVGVSALFDARMRIINADGSEAEMCGNGMRTVARYLDEHDEMDAATVETIAGPIPTRILDREPYRIAVELGVPTIGPPQEIAGFTAIPVDVGNPHVVIRVDDVRAVELEAVGPLIEHDPRYPNGTNVHVVSWDGVWRVRHWERGVGATKACGTGAVAVGSVLIAAGDAVSPVDLNVPGGVLTVVWEPGHGATLIGDAVNEFRRVL
jgi:diaminopimelate epimerase